MQMEYSVTTNNVTTYHNGLYEALEAAEDGSYVKLLRDIFEGEVTFNKAITFDLNGFEMSQPSLYDHIIKANVTFIDSVGGGFMSFDMLIFAECTFISGTYTGIFIEYETDLTIKDFLHSCTSVYKDNQKVILTDEDYVYGSTLKLEHDTINTCIGDKCNICNLTVGESDSNAHKFEVYEKSSEAKCSVNATETSTCIYCNVATHTQEIPDTKLEHIDEDKNHLCDNGCSLVIGEHADVDNDYICDYGCSTQIGEPKEESSVGKITAIVLGSIGGAGGLFALCWFILKKKIF
jgi:hypothetical protein